MVKNHRSCLKVRFALSDKFSIGSYIMNLFNTLAETSSFYWVGDVALVLIFLIFMAVGIKKGFLGLLVGFLGLFMGGFKASAVGISAALIFGYLASLIFEPKMRK